MRYLESIFGNEKFEKFFKGNKVGCVFPMVISSDFRMGKHRDHDREEDAPNFTEHFLIPRIFTPTYFHAHALTSFKAYIQHFSYKAITTEDWKSFLYSYFDSEKEKLDQVDWNLWFNKPGLAPVKGKYDTSLQDVCTKVITRS